jgi:hypothetical protein
VTDGPNPMEEAPVVMPVTVVGLGRRRERKVVGNDEGNARGVQDHPRPVGAATDQPRPTPGELKGRDKTDPMPQALIKNDRAVRLG